MICPLLTDYHAPMHEALRLGFGAVPGLEIMGEAGTGEELLTLLPANELSVVLFDLRLPGPGALTLLPTLGE